MSTLGSSCIGHKIQSTTTRQPLAKNSNFAFKNLYAANKPKMIGAQRTATTLLSMLLIFANTNDAVAQEIMVDNGRVNLETCVNQESQYTIRLEYMGDGEIDDRYVDAFESAALRWTKVVIGDLPDAQPQGIDDWFADTFDRRYAEPVDDVVVGYDIPATIDGAGGTLGSAGAVYVRRDRSGRPMQTISGIMTFDGADLATMPTEDVKAIVQHEMGHVLGLVGTTTGRCTRACDTQNPSLQADYVCPMASREYQQISVGLQGLELENNGGMGTACGHWEEDGFRTSTSSEVMTGFFEADLFQPLSSVTVAGLADLGYEVDYCGADIWPATEDTIKRFEIYKTRRETRMAGQMDRLSPRWEVDEETGEKVPWIMRGDEDTTSSVFGRRLPLIGALVLGGATAALL